MYLHSEGICHRDINPRNILLRRNKVVITDFSSAKILEKKSKNITEIGILEYRAP